jgi:hypothetical protein
MAKKYILVIERGLFLFNIKKPAAVKALYELIIIL